MIFKKGFHDYHKLHMRPLPRTTKRLQSIALCRQLVRGGGSIMMPMAEYQGDPGPEPSLGPGIAKLLVTRSPAHAWAAHPRLNPEYREKESSAFDLGSAAHAM